MKAEGLSYGRRCFSFKRVLAASSLLVLGFQPIGRGGSNQVEKDPSVLFRNHASLIAASLQKNWFVASERRQGWRGVNAWQRFVIIDTLAEYTRITGVQSYLPDMAQAAANRSGLDGNDDDLWAILAALSVYRLTHSPELLSYSQDKFNNLVTHYWDDTCGGGLWWDHARTYKNAITNELLLYAATELYATTAEALYSSWAKREWAWFSQSGLINANYLVNDGLNATCKNNHQPTYTYNQGVILGGLVGLYRIDHDESHLHQASSIALAAIAQLTNNGILVEAVPDLHQDAQSFKGIFVFHLERLFQASIEPGPGQAIRVFLDRNAEQVWMNRNKRTHQIDAYWDSSHQLYGAAAEASGLALMSAALQANSKK